MTHYIDLMKVLRRCKDTFTDFEGLASRTEVDRVLAYPEVVIALRCYPEMAELSTLLKHWVYENVDQTDITPDEKEATDFVHIVAYILGSRYWMVDE